jgi:hypothetical protein
MHLRGMPGVGLAAMAMHSLTCLCSPWQCMPTQEKKKTLTPTENNTRKQQLYLKLNCDNLLKTFDSGSNCSTTSTCMTELDPLTMSGSFHLEMMSKMTDPASLWNSKGVNSGTRLTSPRR